MLINNKELLRSKYDTYLKDGRRESDVYELDYENRVLSAEDMFETDEYYRIKNKLIYDYDFISRFEYGGGFINPILLKWWKYFNIVKDKKELEKWIPKEK
jgi:hypothetical protein